jgi:hypothetical protein
MFNIKESPAYASIGDVILLCGEKAKNLGQKTFL